MTRKSREALLIAALFGLLVLLGMLNRYDELQPVNATNETGALYAGGLP